MSKTRVIEAALTDLAYTENPPGSNKTKFGEWYGINGVPWCVQAQAYWYNKAGEFQAFMGGEKTASCRQLLAWHKQHGHVLADKNQIDVGDLAILNFSGTQETQHIGLVVNKIGYGFFHTVEGNTSPGEEGSQDNGGCVALKTRSVNQVVAVIRPEYKKIPSDVKGHWAESAIEWAMDEGLMNGYPDGTFQPDKPLTRAEYATIEYRKYLRQNDNK